MQTQKVTNCRSCHSNDLQSLKVFEKYPLFDDVVDNTKHGNEYTDKLEIVICNNCNLLQNPKNIDFEEYYSDYVYSSGSSTSAVEYMMALVNETLNLINTKEEVKVIDIGSGDGKLLECFSDKQSKILGFEGSSLLSKIANEKGIPTINSLFSENSSAIIKDFGFESPDLITMLHTFDHIPNPVELIQSISSILKLGKYFLIEVHSLDKMIKQNEGAIFAHEHTCYYSEVTLKNILLSNGFKIIDYNFVEERLMRGASQIILCQKCSTKSPVLDSLSIRNSSMRFIDDLDIANHNVKQYIISKSSPSYRIAGFGGWGRGIGSIAQARLDSNDLCCVFDNNQTLNNCFIPGTNIPIYIPSRENLSNINEVIVFNYGYISEIKNQIRELASHDIKITNINSIRINQQNSSNNLK